MKASLIRERYEHIEALFWIDNEQLCYKYDALGEHELLQTHKFEDIRENKVVAIFDI